MTLVRENQMKNITTNTLTAHLLLREPMVEATAVVVVPTVVAMVPLLVTLELSSNNTVAVAMGLRLLVTTLLPEGSQCM